MPWDSVDNRLTRNRTLADEIQAQIRRAINHRPAKPSTIGVGALKYTDTTPGSGQRDVAFVDLTDTPDTYVTAGNIYKINAGKTALEEVAPADLGLVSVQSLAAGFAPVTVIAAALSASVINIIATPGTIDWIAININVWTPDISADTITVTLYKNSSPTDSFTNTDGTAGVKSGAVSEAVVQGDIVEIKAQVTTQRLGLDTIQFNAWSGRVSGAIT